MGLATWRVQKGAQPSIEVSPAMFELQRWGDGDGGGGGGGRGSGGDKQWTQAAHLQKVSQSVGLQKLWHARFARSPGRFGVQAPGSADERACTTGARTGATTAGESGAETGVLAQKPHDLHLQRWQ